jgi:outer membrane receptor protein involved in Fe transport
MKLTPLLSLCCVFLSSLFSLQAQTPTLSGLVQDQKQSPMEAVTVSLLQAKDSALVKAAITNKGGLFEFEQMRPGQYLLMYTAAGYERRYSAPLTYNGQQVIVPQVSLTPATKTLQQVTVTARKPFIEQKIDRMVVNVDAAVSNAGATALEVLEKSPGVAVDRDGNISLKGKQGVMVMIDNRPTYLSPADLSNLLRSMPANNVETIEIMTNPSAKYDAAGNSGIIHIRTKKNKQKGFNGSATVNYGQGVYWRSNNSTNLNYRNGKWNLFANAGFGFWNGFQQLDIERNFKDPATGIPTAQFSQQSFMRNREQNYNLKLGADYYLTNKTTVGLVLNSGFNPEWNSSSNTSYLKSAVGKLDSIVLSESKQRTDWKNGSLNLNLRHLFDTSGKELTADLDFIGYRNPSTQTFTNTTFNPDWIKRQSTVLEGVLPVDINIYSAKVDYTQPLGKKTKLETGLKTSYVETMNKADYYQNVDDVLYVDYNLTNHFQYQEQIHAAYLNVNKQMGKWGVQGGLRYEQTHAKGLQSGNPTQPDSAFDRTYGGLFPTLFVSYAASEQHQWTVNYGRRIDRPAYQDLNPFLFFIDQYTYQSGNPFILPQYTDNFELSHTYKGRFTTTLNYSDTKDLITETFQQQKIGPDSLGYATIVRKGNIGSRQNAGIAISAQMPVKKWWTLIAFANYNYSWFKGVLDNQEPIDIQAGNLMININNQFRFEKGWSAELSGFYRTKGIEGQIIIEPFGQMSAGVSKQVMKGKGTLKFNVRDMFYTQKVRGEINFQGTEAKFYNIRDSRVGTIAFTYRFGKPIKGTQPRRKTGGAEEEQNRVKSGNN